MLQTVTKTKECINELDVKVLICTWAPPVDLMTDLKVEMDAQIFYATKEVVSAESNSDPRYCAAVMKTSG